MSAKSTPSIIFLGNPDFALAHLVGLIEASFDIKLVITSPDRPAGRKMKLKSPEVATYALANNIPLLQVEDIHSGQLLEKISHINPDFIVVVAFSKIPKTIWSAPKFTTLNVHPSLLPEYRGAAPIQWAIINGETETGISVISVNDKIDSGNIIKQIKIPIKKNDTFGTLYERIKPLGKELLVSTITDLSNRNPINIVEQPSFSVKKKAPKIKQEDCRINFDLTARQVHNHIRGLSPYPTAFTYLNDTYIKIFASSLLIDKTNIHENAPLITDGKTFLYLKCKDDYISITDLQAANKKRLTIKEFLQGWDTKTTLSLQG